MNTAIRLLTIAALGALAQPAAALVYSVGPGDSRGLVQAIEAANASAGADIIQLQRGLYALEQPARDGSDTALPALQGELRIIGNGAELRRYARGDFRLLEVARGANVRIDRVVFAEGSLGAAINHGRLECHHCQFIDHTDRRSIAIIENYGELQLVDSDVSFNTLTNAGRDAGTIVNFGLAGIRASRVHSNNVSRRFQSLALATALLNFGEARLDDVRISDNEFVFGLEYSGYNAGSVINLGNGSAALSNVVEQDNLPAVQAQ